MSFSQEWEETYKKKLHQSIWPWSDLISYVMRYSRPTRRDFRVLELGCGAGANIPFFKKLGAQYFGIDGSRSVIKMLKRRFPDLRNNLIVGDFTKKIPFRGKFNLVVDRASLTHNTTKVIIECVNRLILPKIKVGGKFIGIDWYSTEHDDYKCAGKNKIDKYSASNYTEGQFGGLGVVHFADQKIIKKIFKKFKFELVEHKIYKRIIPAKHTAASWNFIAVKKG